MNCNRCGVSIYFDNGVCIAKNSEMPHDIRRCTTKQGCVYCPECRDSFSQNAPCKHYKEYGYQQGQNEQFFIDLIIKGYKKGDFFNRKKKKKFTAKDRRMKDTKCNQCSKDLNGYSYKEIEAHRKIHEGQKSIFDYNKL